MEQSNNLYKRNPNDIISWVDDTERIGVMLFTFDGKKFFNLFRDYPEELTKEEIEIFDKENPEWAKFFSDRKE